MPAMSCVGVNIGALTVKAVELRGSAKRFWIVPHRGDPLRTVHELLAEAEFSGAEYFGVTGELGHISEVAAIQRALREVPDAFSVSPSMLRQAAVHIQQVLERAAARP